MSERLLAILGLAAALGLGTPALIADHGDKDKHQHGNKHDDRDDDHGWARRDGYKYRVSGDRDAGVPQDGVTAESGLGQLPSPPGPGQKYRCRTSVYQGRRRYYYQDEVGRIIVRRPIIEVRGSVNCPLNLGRRSAAEFSGRAALIQGRVGQG